MQIVPVEKIVVRSLSSEAEAVAFREISEEWLTRYFAVEPADLKALDDPRTGIIAAGGDVLLAIDTESGDVLGCVALVSYPEDVFELAKMGVRPESQGRGVGRALVLAAISRAGELGAAHLFLSTNHELSTALHLYRSCGFVQVQPQEVPVADYYAWRLERADVYMELK
ncbi:GNAT family N-acetyltransferase [Arthrobacter sp. NPDC090010]|uniref:GNAT family N-acetyltransferase n=1 Tax=Arthrobacter sp. NPDC090010 TaxID=3363942 RepID=UPI0038093ACF